MNRSINNVYTEREGAADLVGEVFDASRCLRPSVNIIPPQSRETLHLLHVHEAHQELGLHHRVKNQLFHALVFEEGV